MGLKRDIKSLKLTITDAIANKNFSTEELKKQSVILADQLSTNETLVSQEQELINLKVINLEYKLEKIKKGFIQFDS